MYLRRDQTRAVEEILGDLRADPERHLGVLHHLDEHLRRMVGGHDQPLGRAAPDLGRSPAVLVADHRAVLGLPPGSAAVGSRGVTPDDRRRQQRPPGFAVAPTPTGHDQRLRAGYLFFSAATRAAGSSMVFTARSYATLIDGA